MGPRGKGGWKESGSDTSSMTGSRGGSRSPIGGSRSPTGGSRSPIGGTLHSQISILSGLSGGISRQLSGGSVGKKGAGKGKKGVVGDGTKWLAKVFSLFGFLVLFFCWFLLFKQQFYKNNFYCCPITTI